MKSDRPYLEHIADSIAAIERYVAGGRDVYLQERLIQDAVIRNFEVIGEAATHLSATAGATAAIGVSTIRWSGTSLRTTCLG